MNDRRKTRNGAAWLGTSAALALVLVAGQAHANVYASGLTVDATQFEPSLGQTVEIGYILNENADSNVKIEVLDSSMTVVRTVNLGAQTTGPHSWTWNGRNDGSAIVPDGQYTVKITASDDGHGAWDQLSDDGASINWFYSPRGIDVNKNLDSPYLGRVYIGENGGATLAGRTTADGVYILNADHTDAVAQGDTPRTGGVAWPTPSTSSPYSVHVGPDNKIYVTDWTNGTSGLWAGDPDFDTAVSIFANDNRDAFGLCDNHGSIPGVWVEGAGAARVVYTVDEDWDSTTGDGDIETRHRGSILKYTVGTATGYAGAPEIVYDDDPAVNNYVMNGTVNLARDTNGNWLVTQYRSVGNAPGDIPALLKITPDGSTVTLLGSDLIGQNDADGYPIEFDPFQGISNGLAVDWGRDRLIAGGRNDGYVTVVQLSTIDPGTLTFVLLGTTIRAAAVDAAGNFYTVDSSEELLKQFSPPDGANSFTTPSWFAIQVGEAVVPTEIKADIARSGANEVEIGWAGATAGKTQTVESRDTVGSGAWTDVGSGSGETGSVADDVTGVGGREYRVRQD